MAYSYYRQIDIDSTKVPNTDQTDFPVLVSGTYTYLKNVASGGNVENANGYDIAFYSDEALTTQLDHEVERYVGATGEVIYWVEIPLIEYDVDTVFYIAYGDSGISTSQEDIAGTWESDFKMVFHLTDGTTLDATDSTSNSNDGTITSATAAAGQIGGEAEFSGSTQHIAVTDHASIEPTSAITMSCWIEGDDLLKWAGDDGESQILFRKTGNYILYIYDSTQSQTNLDFYLYGVTYRLSYAVSGNLSNNTAYLVHATYDGSNMKLYIDGTQVATSAQTGSIGTGANDLFIGSQSSGVAEYDGSMDEARIAAVGRSADWCLTEYNNQSSPSTFYTIGSEETPGGGTSEGVGFFSMME